MKRSTPVLILPGCFDFYVVNTFGFIALPTFIIRTFTQKSRGFRFIFLLCYVIIFILYKALPLVYTES